jgi:hypothetical protein
MPPPTTQMMSRIEIVEVDTGVNLLRFGAAAEEGREPTLVAEREVTNPEGDAHDARYDILIEEDVEVEHVIEEEPECAEEADEDCDQEENEMEERDGCFTSVFSVCRRGRAVNTLAVAGEQFYEKTATPSRWRCVKSVLQTGSTRTARCAKAAASAVGRASRCFWRWCTPEQDISAVLASKIGDPALMEDPKVVEEDTVEVAYGMICFSKDVAAGRMPSVFRYMGKCVFCAYRNCACDGRFYDKINKHVKSEDLRFGTGGKMSTMRGLKWLMLMLSLEPENGRYVQNLLYSWRAGCEAQRVAKLEKRSEDVLLVEGDLIATKYYSRCWACFSGNKTQNPFQEPRLFEKLDRNFEKKTIDGLTQKATELIMQVKVDATPITMYGTEHLTVAEQSAIMRMVLRAVKESDLTKLQQARYIKPIYMAVVSPSASEFGFAITQGGNAKI